MFSQKETPKYQRMLESELDRTLVRLRTEMPNSEDYTKTLGLVERLHDMLDDEQPDVVSKNTLLVVGGNLLGIILILKHEHLNPITSKALGFVLRTRA
jgi:hypothetical protein